MVTLKLTRTAGMFTVEAAGPFPGTRIHHEFDSLWTARSYADTLAALRGVQVEVVR
jgi:hypothetical protein